MNKKTSRIYITLASLSWGSLMGITYVILQLSLKYFFYGVNFSDKIMQLDGGHQLLKIRDNIWGARSV